jgi:diaminopimelate epimerase
VTDLRFTKMHGIGNDYLLLNCLEDSVTDPEALARAMSDRHFGVGADGLILVLPAEEGIEAHVRMRMFNADGSEAEMCGNGIRCLCRYIVDRRLVEAKPLQVQTKARILTLDYTADSAGRVEQVTVDMGEPILDVKRVPVDVSQLAWQGVLGHWGFGGEDECWIGVFVSMGNPHVVLFDEEHPGLMPGDLDEIDVAYWGPRIEHHPAFPERINVHWVKVLSRSEVVMRTWERGSGETLACGTGAAAVCVAGVVSGRTERRLHVRLPGGALRLQWDEATNRVRMSGPAAEVFEGTWPVPPRARHR